MTIEEKIDNFKALLRRSYQAKGKEDMMISAALLEEGDLSYRELREVICPNLVAEGFLRSFSLDLHILAKEDLVIRAIDFGKGNISDMEFTSDIPSYEFTVDKYKLNKKFSAAKKSNPPVFNLPPGSKWEDITIKFRDEDKVEILLKDKHFAYSDYKQMHFGKRKKPDMQWNFLRWLAGVYAGSEQLNEESYVPASVDNFVDYLRKNNKAETRENVHTIRRLLSRQLKEDFEIYDEPFDDYEKFDYYKTNFTLISEPPLRWTGKEGIWSADKKFDAVSYRSSSGKIGMTEAEKSIEDLHNDEILEGKEDEA
jgi:hypothetical protein